MFLVFFQANLKLYLFVNIFMVQSHGLGFYEYVFSKFAMNSEEDDLNLRKQKHCIFGI